jgi:hypothetical protein
VHLFTSSSCSNLYFYLVYDVIVPRIMRSELIVSLRTHIRNYFSPKFFLHDFFMDAWYCSNNKLIHGKKNQKLVVLILRYDFVNFNMCSFGYDLMFMYQFTNNSPKFFAQILTKCIFCAPQHKTKKDLKFIGIQ